MILQRTGLSAAALAALLFAQPATAQTVFGVSFVNGLSLSGAATDLSGGNSFESRVGYFSDIYYDRYRNEWWGLSDRGPGGGTLTYETRIQRFTLDIGTNGAISNFQVVQTLKFNEAGIALNGLAPSPSGVLGKSFDPEGMVIHPLNGNVIVSDEYGPSLYEFDRTGKLVRKYTTPDNLVPKVAGTVDYTSAPPTLTSGREPNRGFEGLAVSPDGKFLYAVLQNGTIQDGWTSSSRGLYSRIVKFDTASGAAVAQYAYKLESSSQGRGISSILALGNDRFLVIERNNRGIGVGATLASADKSVYEIDLSSAIDVTGLSLPASGNVAGAATKVAKVIDLDVDTLQALGNKSPEKWEGLAVGPKLANGKYLLLAGTDNDYSVTQNGSNTQFDVYFRFSDADPYAQSIQCPAGTISGCFFTTGGALTSLTSDYRLLPGVLHAYTGDIANYTAPIPEPQTWLLMIGGLVAMGSLTRRR